MKTAFRLMTILLGLLAASGALAEELELTVYNNNLALVKETRILTLERGIGEYNCVGVPERLIPETVHFKSLTDPAGTAVLEQNYRYDLLDRGSLLKRYRGQEVKALVDDEWRTVTLLAHGHPGGEGQAIGRILEVDGEIHIEGFILPELPEGLLLEPTLLWLLDAKKRGRHEIELDYLTEGLGWRADYVAVIDNDNKLDLTSWVTLNNHSGRNYEDARLKLVAGDVQRVSSFRAQNARPEMAMDARSFGNAAKGFQEEEFFEYHLYTLGRPTTVLDKEQKQVELLSAAGVQAERRYVFASSSYQEDREPRALDVKIEFDNSENDGLGIPLPKGIVRVYQADKQGRLQFAGEDRIDHTPKDETLSLKLGTAFDLRGERVRTDLKQGRNGRITEQSYRITLRNHKGEAITVSVQEMAPSRQMWRIFNASHKWEKITSNRFEFEVQVPAAGETTITYTIRN
ncbi:MAG: DUF4139 domain-containing protein [bacterium]|nr:DUF4139 domain-containing protein [bacterium]